MEWCFRVRLSHVRVTGLSAGGATRPPGAAPYFRCDVDGKALRSERCGKAGDPAWSTDASFEYRLVEDDLQAVVTSLASRLAAFDVYYAPAASGIPFEAGSSAALAAAAGVGAITETGAAPVTDIHVGRAAVDLFSLAVGASSLRLTLKGNTLGEAAGTLHCRLSFEQVTDVTINVAALSLTSLPEPMPSMLSVSVVPAPEFVKQRQDAGLLGASNLRIGTSAGAHMAGPGGQSSEAGVATVAFPAPVESSVSPPTNSPVFERVPAVRLRCSLRQLLEEAALRVAVLDVAHGGATAGVVTLPLAALITSTADHTAHFRRNLYHDNSWRRSFTALAEGIVAFTGLPRFSPLSSECASENVDGRCHGRPMLECCLRPANFSKFPAKLPAYKGGGALESPDAPPEASGDALGNGNFAAAVGPADGAAARIAVASGTAAPGSAAAAMATTRRGELLGDRESIGGPHSSGLHSAAPSVAPGAQPQLLVGSEHTRPRRGAPPHVATLDPRGQATPTVSHVDAYSTTHVPPQPDAQGGLAPTGRPTPMQDLGAGVEAQHVAATRAIAEQQQQVAQRAAQLEVRAEREAQAARVRVEAVVAEERLLRERLDGVAARADELRREADELDAEAMALAAGDGVPVLGDGGQRRVVGSAPEMAALEGELEELSALEAHLQTLRAQLLAQADADAKAREAARQRAAEAERRVSTSRAALLEIESTFRRPPQHPAPGDGGAVHPPGAFGDPQPGMHQQRQPSFGTPASPPRSSSFMPVPYGFGAPCGAAAAQVSFREPVVEDQPVAIPASSAAVSSSFAAPPAAVAGSFVARTPAPPASSPMRRLGATPSGPFPSPTPPAAGSYPGSRRGSGSAAPPVEHRTDSPKRRRAAEAASSGAAAVTAAIDTGDPVAFLRLLHAQGDAVVRAAEPTVLIRACAQPAPSRQIVEALLRARPELVHATEPGTGASALHCACAAVQPDAAVIELLMQAGANFLTFDHRGLAPLHVAVCNGADSVTHAVKRTLVRLAGPEILGARTGRGETPAHLCATTDDRLAALRFLVENGAPLADLASVPDHGARGPGVSVQCTPLQLARRCGAQAVARFLEAVA